MNVLCFVISVHMEDIMTIIKDGSKNLMNVQIPDVIADANKKMKNNILSYFSILFCYYFMIILVIFFNDYIYVIINRISFNRKLIYNFVLNIYIF